MKRKPHLWEALIPILSLLIFQGVGKGYFGYSSEILLIMSGLIAAVIAMRVGLKWDEMQKGLLHKISTALPSSLILVSVGMLIGSWMISGTIPMMVYYGIQFISPTYIALTAFLSAACISTVTGTSYGSAGTVGVAFMGVAAALGASLPITAGAVVAGAYFGDKMSPLSDTTNLAPMIAGCELYEHIKHMIWTTAPAALLSIVVYALVGRSSIAVTGDVNPENVKLMLSQLETMYHFNILLFVPVIIVLYGSFKQYPTLPVMLGASFFACLIGYFLQGFEIKAIMDAMVKGFDVSMIKAAGFDASNATPGITKLLNRGGMRGMMNTVLLVFCACSFSGIVTKSLCLEVVLDRIMKFVKNSRALVVANIIAACIMALVTGGSYSTTILTGELFRDAYRKMGVHLKTLSRTCEDCGTVFVPLIPWSTAGIFMSGTLGVSTLEYAPWAVLCYTGIVFALMYAATGFTIEKANYGETEAVEIK